MISKIFLKNFRSFKGPIHQIPLGKITLIFGANSSGKSSILRSIQILKQSISSVHPNLKILDPGFFGEVQELIYGYKNEFSLGLELEGNRSVIWNFNSKKNSIDSVFGKCTLLNKGRFGDPPKFNYRINKIPGKISEYSMKFDKDNLLKFFLKENRKEVEKTISLWNTAIDDFLDFFKVIEKVLSINENISRKEFHQRVDSRFSLDLQGCSLYSDLETVFLNSIGRENNLIYQENLNSQILVFKENLLNENDLIRTLENDTILFNYLSNLTTFTSSLFVKDPLKMDTNLFSLGVECIEIRDAFDRFFICKLLAHCDRGIPHYYNIHSGIRQSLYNVRYLAPLRKDPLISENRELLRKLLDISNLTPLKKDLLSFENKELLRKFLNNIKFARKLLELDDENEQKEVRSVGLKGEYTFKILRQGTVSLDKVNTTLSNLGIDYLINNDLLNDPEDKLHDITLEIDVNVRNIGFGISQLLPIIVQSLIPDDQILCIEQPEIHLHPKLQSELMEFFVRRIIDEDSRDLQYIIETHSEYLLLRLQKLIRDGVITRQDVSIIYVEGDEEGSIARPLEFDREGEFIYGWPTDFSDQRLRDLYG